MRILICMPWLTIATAQIGEIKSFPGYVNADVCVQDAFTGCLAGSCLFEALGCTDMDCVCIQFTEAITDIAHLASSSCTDSGDIGTATSILSAFCTRYSASPGTSYAQFQVSNFISSDILLDHLDLHSVIRQLEPYSDIYFDGHCG
jgi:hypothetical protein